MNKLDIIDFFDEARWSKENNCKDYLNYKYSEETISNHEKILIHWLTYIMDRQMPYEQIWNIGAYIFNDIVRDYWQGKSVEQLLNVNKSNSYFKLFNQKNNKDADYFFWTKKSEDNKLLDKYYNQNEKKKIYEISSDEIIFKSRFYTSDYFSIYNTLYILNDLKNSGHIKEKSIISYMEKIIQVNKELTVSEIINKIAYGLYILTYSNIGQPKKEAIENFCKNEKDEARKKIKECLEKIKIFLANKERLQDEIKYYKKDIYNSKRIWCCIRDYIRDNYYSSYFKSELKDDIKYILFESNGNPRNETLNALILPGDVWNNNSIFRSCFFGEEEIKNREQLNKWLKENYDKYNCEKMDITFSFVPKMCAKNNCDICPIDKYIKKNMNNKFDKLCTMTEGKYCSVALSCAGYKYVCNPKKCLFAKEGE